AWTSSTTSPEFAAIVNDAMTALSAAESRAVADAYDFSEIRTIADVCGRHGLLLATVRRANPSMRASRAFLLGQRLHHEAGDPQLGRRARMPNPPKLSSRRAPGPEGAAGRAGALAGRRLGHREFPDLEMLVQTCGGRERIDAERQGRMVAARGHGLPQVSCRSHAA